MALRKPAQTAQFEDVSSDQLGTDDIQQEATETKVDTNNTPANDDAQVAAKADPAPSPSPAPAAVPAVRTTSTAVAARDEIAAQAKAFQRELDDMKGGADFSFGNYDVFKGNNGEIAQTGDKGVSLGRWAKVRLLAWDDHYEITPGSQEKSTKDFVAYSKDGRVIDHVIGDELKKWEGKSTEEYLAYLRETEGFDNASNKRYVDMSCALLGTDSGEGPIGEVIQVTLSPSSIPAFTKYQQKLKDSAKCAAMGLPGFKVPEDPFSFFMVREVAAKDNNKWTKLAFFAQLPAKI